MGGLDARAAHGHVRAGGRGGGGVTVAPGKDAGARVPFGSASYDRLNLLMIGC